MRVLVTGGAGFIGSHVTDALVARGDEVLVVDDLSRGRREQLSEKTTLHVRDIRTSLTELVTEWRPDAIAHLAAQIDVRVSVADPALDADVNVVGTASVLDAARSVGCRVVFASSGGAIYGECDRPAREDDPCRPLAPYGAAKLAGEHYLATFARLTGAPHVALRYGNVYGPRQDPHGEAGVVAIFLSRLRDGEACTVFGDGGQTRDYVHVVDVARATVAALDSASAGVFNVGTGRETSVLDLVAACAEVAGTPLDHVFAPRRAGELDRSVLDPALAREALGFEATTSLHDGLRSTWEWLREE